MEDSHEIISLVFPCLWIYLKTENNGLSEVRKRRKPKWRIHTSSQLKNKTHKNMSIFLDLNSAIFILLLIICSATHIREFRPTWFTRDSPEMYNSFLYKCSVIGNRLSPWVAALCVAQAFYILFMS